MSGDGQASDGHRFGCKLHKVRYGEDERGSAFSLGEDNIASVCIGLKPKSFGTSLATQKFLGPCSGSRGLVRVPSPGQFSASGLPLGPGNQELTLGGNRTHSVNVLRNWRCFP